MSSFVDQWPNLVLFIKFFLGIPIGLFLLYLTSRIISKAIYDSYLEMREKMKRDFRDTLTDILNKQGGKENGAK